MQRKVIAISFIGGRVGSSLVMGLLEKSGIAVGPINKTCSKQNAKGFYEINEYNEWLWDEFPFVNQFMPPVPDYFGSLIVETIVKQERFYMFIDKLFKDKLFIAIKAPYYFPVFLFDDRFDVTIISLKRNMPEQVKSIEKWNTKEGDFKGWIKDWEKLLLDAPKPSCEIYFEEWFQEPYKTYLKLCEVVDPPKVLSEKEVLEWIDPELKHY